MSHVPFDAGGPNSIPVLTNPRSTEDSALRATLFPNDSWNGSCPFLFHTCELNSGHNSRKRFLVFDQSGDKTTIVHSSGSQTQVQHRICQRPNSFIRSNLCNDEPESSTRPYMVNEMEDEMHEDTEELDALLCSDSDETPIDDEETSTGHSPSTMTDENVRVLAEENGEEVDSTPAGPPKRQRLFDGGYARLLHDTESWCGNANKTPVDELNSFSSNVVSRKERVRETLRLLRNAIPYDVSGKDAIAVIDEAIRYLKSLKDEAEALEMNDD